MNLLEFWHENRYSYLSGLAGEPLAMVLEYVSKNHDIQSMSKEELKILLNDYVDEYIFGDSSWLN